MAISIEPVRSGREDGALSARRVRLRAWLGAPDGLLGRMRWAFTVFTLLAVGLSSIAMLRLDLAVWPDRVGGALASGLLVLWAVRSFRSSRYRTIDDLAGPALLLLVGVLLAGVSTVGLIGLGAMGLHLLSVERRRAVLVGAGYFASLQITVAVSNEPTMMVTGANAVSTGVAVVLVALLVQLLRSFGLAHERLMGRERVLTDAGRALLAAQDVASADAAAVDGAVQLAGPRATVALWCGPDPWRVVAHDGSTGLDGVSIPEAEVPSDLAIALRMGRPFTVRGEPAAVWPAGRDGSGGGGVILVVPMDGADATRRALAVGLDGPPDEQVIDALERFAVQIGLAIGRVELTEEVQRRADLLRGVLDNSSDVIVLLDGDGGVRFVSPSVRDVLGLEPDELEGGSLGRLIDHRDLGTLEEHLELLGEGGERRITCECRMLRRDGSWRDAEVAATKVAGVSTRYVLNIRDATDRKELEREITYRAFHDQVTGIANRALFADRLDHALARAERTGHMVGLAVVDLDDFKAVNDNLGHAAGDAMLAAVAGRLGDELRASDTAARIGGDEFGLIIEDIEHPEEADEIIGRVLDGLRVPVDIRGRLLPVHASAGVAVAGPDESDPEMLMRNADVALYAAKSAGKGGYEVFRQSMRVAELDRLELRGDLQRALGGDELALHYQPIVDLRTGEPAGVEALLRWQHPTRGWIPPDTFVPLAEDSRLIVPLGAWILEHACQQFVGWRDAGALHPGMTLNVNISAVQIHESALVDHVDAAIGRSGIDPSLLVLEITETALMTDADRAMRTIHTLKELGVSIAVDDFGTGYSSLSYLHRFPVDQLKIDAEFVSHVDEGPEESAIANAIVKLSQTLGIVAVAEGVETREQCRMLVGWGCHLGQGYRYAPPLPGAVIPRWLGTGAISVDDVGLHGAHPDAAGGEVEHTVVTVGNPDRSGSDGRVSSGTGMTTGA